MGIYLNHGTIYCCMIKLYINSVLGIICVSHVTTTCPHNQTTSDFLINNIFSYLTGPQLLGALVWATIFGNPLLLLCHSQ
jgi:hypothetical protein